MDLKEIRWKDVHWIHLAQDRDQFWAFCEIGNELSGSMKCLKFL
jgi:hypothetical protein